jgi:hypothetical protein
MNEFTHLLPAARAIAVEGPQERIRRIQMDRWIGYTRAEAALAQMQTLFTFPRRSRMPNLILVGASNNGKSMVAEKFCRHHGCTESDDSETASLRSPVLKIQMPAVPDDKLLFAAILERLGVPERLNERLLARQTTAVRLMRCACVRLLIIDELHNLLVGTRPQQSRLLNLLRWMGNELRIPLVAVGTAEALRAVQSDDQLANRFTPFVLPLWQMGAEYLRLLNTLEAVLPLRNPSQLAQGALAQRILVAAEGTLGEIVTLVTLAAVHAITSGEERITPGTLDRVDFVPPSRRRHAADQSLSG